MFFLSTTCQVRYELVHRSILAFEDMSVERSSESLIKTKAKRDEYFKE